VASAIYYYNADPEIVDEGLSLRRVRDVDGDEFPNVERYRRDVSLTFVFTF